MRLWPIKKNFLAESSVKFLFFCFILFASRLALSIEIIELIISGNGCDKQVLRQVKPVRGDEYQFPFIFSIMKRDSSKLERKACMLAFPLVLGKKEKIQISNVSQNLTLKAFGGAHLKLILDVTAVGGKSAKPFEIEIKNPTALDQDMKIDGVVFESKCGAPVLVRADVNAFVQGPGTASATTGDLKLTMKTVACR